MALPNDAVRFNPEAGTAEIHVNDLHLSDFFSIPNGINKGAHDAATVSFDASWGKPVTRRVTVQDTQFGFAGTFAEEHATVNWSGRNDTTGFSIKAKQAYFATTAALGATAFAEVGFERNGVFFEPDDADGHEGHDDNAALVRALADLTGVPGHSDGKLLPNPRGADSKTADSGSAGQPNEPQSTSGHSAASVPSTRALDPLFADADGTAFADLLRR